VVEAVRQPPQAHGLARARWRLGDLAAVVAGLVGYSPSGVSRALRRLRVSRQRGRLAVHSPDPAYQQKLAWVARAAALARRPDSGVTVLYGDEFSLYRQPTLAATYAPRRQAPVARLSHRANTRHRLSGALDLATGRVTWLARSKMGVENLTRFLAKLRRAYPASRRLILIWDNWPVHLNPAVLEAAGALGIELLWLPTYAPWTNPIEKLWRWLKQDKLHHHRLADRWAELQAEVWAWLDQFAGPSPDLLRYVGLSD
jgi:transposase